MVRIGGALGFWGELSHGPEQLLAAGVDYLVFDYLAEITMSIMARARASQPDLGYATDFIGLLKHNLQSIQRRGVKVISSAGGINPRSCAAAIRRVLADADVDLTVAVVTGDDLIDRVEDLSTSNLREMDSREPLPPVAHIVSVNAYLGAFPVAKALKEGADIVVTGRVADSALVLGPCIHEFGWKAEDVNELAGASVAGHVLECSTQATGGNFTDWRAVAHELQEIGYPIAEISGDGTFVCTKPEDTGGRVTIATVSEQLLYEIDDPQAYILPDVICDFAGIELTQVGPDRVQVRGVCGRPPSTSYKVSATYADGFRGGDVVFFYGDDAGEKARVFAQAAIQQAEAHLARRGLGPLTETFVEVVGDASHFGDSPSSGGSREVALKIAAKHPDPKGVQTLLQAVVGSALRAPPGLAAFAGGRPRPSPVVRLFSFLHPKDAISVRVEFNGRVVPVEIPTGRPFDPETIQRPPPPAAVSPTEATVTVPLVELAWGRSGDKGNHANIGIIARRPEHLPWIWASLTEEVVAHRFRHFLSGPVHRYALPGIHAVNFVLRDVLGGGGVASLRNDPQGKSYAQILLSHPIRVPASMAAAGNLSLL